jgi:hypothetical protein
MSTENRYAKMVRRVVRESGGSITGVGKAIVAAMLILSSLIMAPAMAQQADSKGTDFWLMFNGNLAGGGEVVNLFLTGDTAATGTVEIPGLAFSTPFSVTPGTVTTVTLPLAVRVDSSDTVENKGVHVTADQEVTVYGLNRRDSTTDAFIGLPTDILGTDYINLGYANVNVVNGTQFGIVASQDNTTVTITPSVTTGARTAGVPYNITLNQGETYQLRNASPAPADLSGTIIQSDLPIAVFGSHQCANIPQGFTACDHIVEQLPPTTTWGTAFVTFPLATRLNGDTFRILAAEDVTTVSINGSVVATLNRAEFHETILTAGSVINTDKPVLVAQYSHGTSFDGVTSDPFEVLVPPFEQFLAGYTVTTPATGFAINFVSVVAPNAAVGAITLDGAPIPAGDYTPIGASGFSGVAVPVSLGSHNLAGPLPFGLSSYGFDSADSYGYPGGLGLAQVAELTDLGLTPATATNPINTQHCVIATTLDQGGNPLPGIRVDFTVAGVNPNSGFIFTDANGEAEFCYTGTVVGDDIVTATVGNLSATASKTWTDIAVQRCDVDSSGVVDISDIRAIAAARNTPAAGPTDPRDADGNGIIRANDARKCVLQCTNSRCAP